ncbi:MAG TPA: adenylosuccinate lyase [Fimbriimonadaceae bacterium]|nr:adenylosuccinate lyase [Fimbriimonadaceae bacterium]HRJ97583.1 adenylosuccinate lyase [Fimbriimonadaceae bacterium]
MIERYTTPAMHAIWSRQAKYERWLEVEIAVCRAHAEEGSIPQDALEIIESRARFDLARCDEIERETRHDLMAFVRNVAEEVGPEGRFVHLGVTSYDIIDTALGMMLRDSCQVLLESVAGLMRETERLAREHAATPMIGRTHGIHAEPITFGFKVANWHAELRRNASRLQEIQRDVAVGKVSGAVGIHAVASPQLEARVCELLGLRPDEASTQIVNRDRHAAFMNALALLGAGLERIATELRNLQRTEILEVQEAFAAGQTGSSAMPHKRNPWNSETVCGLARLLRANAHAMLESVATWHERDLTNSSLERIVFPDSCHLADFMLHRVRTILEGLEVYPEAMKTNLRRMGDLVFSEHVMIALIGKGLSREDAYRVAQRSAAAAWEGADFRTTVAEDPEVAARLTAAEIDEIFSLEHHLRHAEHSLREAGIS